MQRTWIFNIMMIGTLLAVPLISTPAMAENPVDAETIGIVATIDRNEIQMAKEAAKKKISPEVADYAAMLQKDHQNDLEQVMKLAKDLGISAHDTTVIKTLQTQGAQELSRIAPLDGLDFERAYLTAMVNGHGAARDMVDDRLTKTVDINIRKHIQELRSVITQHLDQAKQLQH